MNVADAVVLAAYASLVVEIVLFPIPSEASTWQLLASRADEGGSALAQARRRPVPVKVLLYALPTALGVALFLLPLACILAKQTGPQWLSSTPPPAWRVAAGLAVILAGRAITFASVLQLRAARAAPQWAPRGLFRVSRNPGLCGMFVFYVGLCLVCPVPWLWIGLPLYVANMHQRVRLEESHLLARHGRAWSDYAERVPRYVGWRSG